MYELLIGPFAEFSFMQRALVGTLAIALGGGPIGVFLMLRRMSLTGDAMAHAILPGAAIGYLFAGLSLPAMSIGGLAAGVVVAVRGGPGVAVHGAEGGCVAGRLLPAVARARRHHRVAARLQRRSVSRPVRHGAGPRRRDPVVAGLDLDRDGCGRWRSSIVPLVLECVDPVFLRSVSRAGTPTHLAFLGLVVLNLVGGFHALGHAARGRHDDAAGRRLPVLGERHHHLMIVLAS